MREIPLRKAPKFRKRPADLRVNKESVDCGPPKKEKITDICSSAENTTYGRVGKEENTAIPLLTNASS